MTVADASVVLGRFSPYTRSHHAQLLAALGQPGRIAVVIGSAFHPRTPRDPFTWREREAMIRACLPAGAEERVDFVPVRDYYDDGRWAAALKRAVRSVLPQARRPRLVPASPRNLACYRERLPEWPQLEPVGAGVDDKALRRILLSGDEALERRIAAMVQPEVLGYLAAWAKLPHHAELAEEQRSNEAERAKWAAAPYEPTFTTVDAVVRAAGHVLLVKRKHPPGRGLWALPGGFLDPRERLATSAIREVREETSLEIPDGALHRRLHDVAVFDHPDRAVRGRTITHAHYFRLPDRKLPEVLGADDAAQARWIAVGELQGLEEQLFEDHFHILDHFLELT